MLEGEQANAIELALEHPVRPGEPLLRERRRHRLNPLREGGRHRKNAAAGTGTVGPSICATMTPADLSTMRISVIPPSPARSARLTSAARHFLNIDRAGWSRRVSRRSDTRAQCAVPRVSPRRSSPTTKIRVSSAPTRIRGATGQAASGGASVTPYPCARAAPLLLEERRDA